MLQVAFLGNNGNKVLKRHNSLSIKMSEKKDKKRNTCYILLKDTVGVEKPKKGFSGLLKFGNGASPKNALAGSIYYKDHEKNGEEEPLTFTFISVDNPEYSINCIEDKLRPLVRAEYELLVAVASNNERMKMLGTELFQEILMIKKGDMVTVEKDLHDGLQHERGRIQYIGPIPHKSGNQFGVVFEKPVGNSDGNLDGQVYFHAHKNCGMFVGANKITSVIKKADIPHDYIEQKQQQNPKMKDKSESNKFSYSLPQTRGAEARKNSKKAATSSSETKRNKHVQTIGNDLGEFCVGERVVQFGDDGAAIHGTLKFLGFISKYNDLHYAGVEMDNPTKNQLGHYFEGRKVFDCPKYKGVIARPGELMTETAYIKQINEEKYKEKSIQKSIPSENVSVGFPDKKEEILQEVLNKEFMEDKIRTEQKDGLKKVKKDNTQKTTVDLEMQQLDKQKKTADDIPQKTYSASVESTYPELNRNEESNNINTSNVKKPIISEDSHMTDNVNPYPNQPIYEEIHHTGNINKQPERGIPDLYRVDTTELKGSSMLDNAKIYFPPNFGNQGSNQENITEHSPMSAPQQHFDNPKSELRGNHQNEQRNEEDAKGRKTELSEGMMVEITANRRPYYGVIRWLGDVIIQEKLQYLAGLELEDYSDLATTDGMFQSVRYFTCPPGKAFFIKAKKCKPDRRFQDSSQIKPVEIRRQDNAQEGLAINVLTGYFPPAKQLKNKYVGRIKGIQGHHNSCYMDSSLFAMFAFSDAFDVALHRKQRKKINPPEDYDEVQRILKEEIVNPLRTCGIVSQKSVMKLRKILERHTNIGGFMTEEKDPEELLVLLFEKVLGLDPFIKLRTGDGHVNESLLFQIFPPEVKTDFPPSIQSLLELSLIDSGLLLDEIPSVMALQMPRFGQQKMFERILINPKLDLTNILHAKRKVCEVCGVPASFICKKCAGKAFGREKNTIFFCDYCKDVFHKHSDRKDHAPTKLPEETHIIEDSELEGRCEMDLFAVVCINTSHYVSFVKCGEGDEEKWVFFDSMADRQGGDENGFNIPEVTEINKLKEYLAGNIVQVAKLEKIKPIPRNFNEPVDEAKNYENKINEKLLRFYEDASLCLYRNKRFIGYQ